MKLEIICQNCNQNEHSINGHNVTSSISLSFELEKVVSIQSPNQLLKSLKEKIREQLSVYSWINCGDIQIEITWYISDFHKRETDKIGDLDNITKPIIDSLAGKRGIFVDDSQITVIETKWFRKDSLLSYTPLYINILMNNEFSLNKKNLYFVEYMDSMCFPINIEIDKIRNILSLNKLIDFKRSQKTNMKKLLKSNPNSYFSYFFPDFHKSRLNGFSNEKILDCKTIKKEKKIIDKQISGILQTLIKT